MIVESQIARFDSIPLDNGATLAPVDVAYETYGELNTARSNAILILHAFSGDAHAAGVSAENGKPGWWDNMIGPGKAFDTNKYFVLSSNILGGCRGSSGLCPIRMRWRRLFRSPQQPGTARSRLRSTRSAGRLSSPTRTGTKAITT